MADNTMTMADNSGVMSRQEFTAYEEGAKARRDGDINGNSNPYKATLTILAWDRGWIMQDRIMGKAADDTLSRAIKQIDNHRRVHDTLTSLGIDPYELRDYLRDLPARS